MTGSLSKLLTMSKSKIAILGSNSFLASYIQKYFNELTPTNQGYFFMTHPHSSLIINKLDIDGYQTVIEGIDPSCNLHCIIAVHNTTLGPALGGARIRAYKNREEGLDDVLRLAKAMTYKSAIVEDGLGGGKSVIFGEPKQKTKAMLVSFGHAVNSLKGQYIVAEDVGTTIEDMEVIRSVTPYVAALPAEMLKPRVFSSNRSLRYSGTERARDP